MNYLSLSIIALLLWGTYILFGNKANAQHGENITMLFEAAAMMIIAVACSWNSKADFGRVTLRSAFYAACMGSMSAFGFYLVMRAIRLEPGRVSTISMITGIYPIITMFAAAIAGQQSLTPKGVIGAVLAMVGLILVSFK